MCKLNRPNTSSYAYHINTEVDVLSTIYVTERNALRLINARYGRGSVSSALAHKESISTPGVASYSTISSLLTTHLDQ